MFLKHAVLATLLLSSHVCFSVSGDQSLPGFLPPKPLTVGLKRPFRIGMMKLSPSTDHQKPLAPVDYSGWVEQSGLLIGSPESKTVLAFSLKRKMEVWRRALRADLTAPAFPLEDSVVLVQLDGSVSRLDLQTGNFIWEMKLPSFVPYELVKDNERIFAVTATQVLYAINIRDGKIEWLYDPELAHEIRIHNTAPPFLYASQLFWGLSNGDIVGIESKTGKKLWRQNPRLGGGGRFHNYMGSMFVSNKRLLFCRYDGLIGAASLESGHEGELLWHMEGSTGNCADSDYRSGRFYAVTTTGDAFAFNPDTGKNLWPALKLGPNLSTVSAVEDYVFATGADGQIYALTPAGELAWYDNLDGRILSRPFFIESVAYFSTGLKNIYAYKI